jgi:hypothetical protein
MQQPPNTIILCEEALASLWRSLVTTLGIHTARVLLARAIWQTAQRHPDIALIHRDDAGLTFEVLETTYAARPQKEIEAAFNDLSAGLQFILARLLGRKIDQQTCADWSLMTREAA